jgi:hypothetical protein
MSLTKVPESRLLEGKIPGGELEAKSNYVFIGSF